MNKRSKYGKGVNLTSALFWLFHTSNVLNNTLITIAKNHTGLQMWVTFKNFQRCLQLLALYLCETRRKAINKKKIVYHIACESSCNCYFATDYKVERTYSFICLQLFTTR